MALALKTCFAFCRICYQKNSRSWQLKVSLQITNLVFVWTFVANCFTRQQKGLPMLPILFLCKSIIWFLIRKCLQISRLPAKEEAKRQLTVKSIFTNYKLGTCFELLLQIVLPDSKKDNQCYWFSFLCKSIIWFLIWKCMKIPRLADK